MHIHLVQVQLRGKGVMKVRGSEMPHGWVKPGPIGGWAQVVICNLKA